MDIDILAALINDRDKGLISYSKFDELSRDIVGMDSRVAAETAKALREEKNKKK